MTEQELAFKKLEKLKVGALFMEMGTGKTKVALDLMCSKAAKVDYFLWICPFSLKPEIEAERQKWHPELELDIVGCESIGSSGRIYLDLLNQIQTKRTFIVVDESLKIKNRKAKRTSRILQMGQYARYKLVLNGTPLSKNCLDLWTQMEFLSPKILEMDYRTFKDTFTEYYVRGRLKGLVKKQHNTEYLISLIEPYIFDAKLDIKNSKSYRDYYYYMDDRAEYEQLKHGFFGFENLDTMSMFQVLQQHYCKSQQKQEVINKIVADQSEKFIVFVKYLSSIPDDAVSITGADNLPERTEKLKRFKDGDFNVLYMTYGCGAFGLNLQFCHNIVFSDHTFDYAQQVQSEARIFRLGQKNDVTYHNIWCKCGLENLIKHFS